MLQNSFGVSLSYASVDRGDGSDPRAAATEVLSLLRVPAGVRDATSAWGGREEAVLAIPVTDDGRVLTLSAKDTIETTLSRGDLIKAFRGQGLTLWLGKDDDEAIAFDPEEAIGQSSAEDFEEPSEQTDADVDQALFHQPVVQVSVFSHRGPAVARALASVHGSAVDHSESGDWSLQQYASSEPTGRWVTSRAELPLIELNRVDSAAWFEVTASGEGPVAFWPDAERDTRPVIDIDSLRVPETAEICRRLLTEGDGSRDELLEIAAVVNLNVDAAHRALIPEALGGVSGSAARQHAFLAAFGVSPDLLRVVFEGGAAPTQRGFAPVGQGIALWETAIAGLGELTPLTRRERPLARLGQALHRRPSLGLGLAFVELAAGVWITSRVRGGGRVLGVVLMIDSLIDAVIWIARIRRGRRG